MNLSVVQHHHLLRASRALERQKHPDRSAIAERILAYPQGGFGSDFAVITDILQLSRGGRKGNK